MNLVESQNTERQTDDDDKNDCAQSDLVRIVLNLAFLSQEDIKSMTFDQEGIQKL